MKNSLPRFLVMITLILGVVSFNLKANAEESNRSIAVYDKFGDQVMPVRVYNNVVMPKGATPPTDLHWITFGNPYHSNPFSATGTRYSEHIFGLDGVNTAKLDFELGGFALFMTDRPDPGAIVGMYNLPLEHAPYFIHNPAYFYFAVDNPVKGQTYNIIGYNK